MCLGSKVAANPSNQQQLQSTSSHPQSETRAPPPGREISTSWAKTNYGWRRDLTKTVGVSQRVDLDEFYGPAQDLEESVIYQVTMTHEDPYTQTISKYKVEVKEGEDPTAICHAFAEEESKDILQREKICYLLRRAVNRLEEPIFLSLEYFLDLGEDVEKAHLPLDIRIGDDIYQLVSWEITRRRLNPGFIDIIVQKVKSELQNVDEGLEWVKKRVELSYDPTLYCDSEAIEYVPHRFSYETSLEEKVFKDLTLALTTSKRLELFENTINSLVNQLDGWSFERIIIVDDGSSQDDLIRMRELVPEAIIISKPEYLKFFDKYSSHFFLRGHAQSMNIITDMVDSSFLFYLEDDWEATEDFTPQNILHSLFLLSSMRDVGGTTAQILFNDQTTRNCAVGKMCSESRDGLSSTAGWERLELSIISV